MIKHLKYFVSFRNRDIVTSLKNEDFFKLVFYLSSTFSSLDIPHSTKARPKTEMIMMKQQEKQRKEIFGIFLNVYNVGND